MPVDLGRAAPAEDAFVEAAAAQHRLLEQTWHTALRNHPRHAPGVQTHYPMVEVPKPQHLSGVPLLSEPLARLRAAPTEAKVLSLAEKVCGVIQDQLATVVLALDLSRFPDQERWTALDEALRQLLDELSTHLWGL